MEVGLPGDTIAIRLLDVTNKRKLSTGSAVRLGGQHIEYQAGPRVTASCGLCVEEPR